MTNTGQELSQRVAEISYKDLPEPVVHKTKQVLLDSIGCALGGLITDRARITLELINEFGGNPQATIISGGRTSCPQAAYANAELIHALCFEACGPTGHIAPYVISPSLAIAEMKKASGKELITAIALALEVGERAFRSVPMTLPRETPPYYEMNPFFSFGTTLVFGGVAGASHLLRLDSTHIANAFGIAGTSMPIPATQSWFGIPGPAIMTALNTLTGWIAQLATTACLLAERGFTGDTTFLDSEWGLRKVLGVGDFKPEIAVYDLGKKWHIEEIWIKAYPCCGCNQTGIDLIYKIVQENNINPVSIEEIVVKSSPTLLGNPWNRPLSKPFSFADCQNYNAYVFAVAAWGQKPGPNWQTPDTYKDQNVWNLMNRVRMEVYPGAEEFVAARLKANLFPDVSDTIVEITANGKRYTAEGKSDIFPAMEQTRDTRKPLSDDEIKAKFRNNASYSSLRSDKVDSVIDAIYRLDEAEDVSEVLKMLGV